MGSRALHRPGLVPHPEVAQPFAIAGPEFDTTTFSDEYCKYGEFTGTMVGVAVTDAALHEKTADFDFFDYEADETKPVD